MTEAQIITPRIPPIAETLRHLEMTLKPDEEFEIAYSLFQSKYYARSMYCLNEDSITNPYIADLAMLPDEDGHGGPYSDYMTLEDSYAKLESPADIDNKRIASLREVMRIYAETHRGVNNSNSLAEELRTKSETYKVFSRSYDQFLTVAKQIRESGTAISSAVIGLNLQDSPDMHYGELYTLVANNPKDHLMVRALTELIADYPDIIDYINRPRGK